ncbi:MAG: ParB N-terminal domain-containing protein [Clostridia bacterium]|nr:ParB N-terminal domain-containing protein [Clostridia bacterium]
MQIEKINIEDIKTYENNAKLHPAEQIEQIKKSIEEFGFNDPLAIDENNVIIEGHGRYIALKELGYKEVEVIRLEHLTEEQRKAYMLVHNKLTMNTDFDFELLQEELEGILDIDMEDFGFNLDIEELPEVEKEEPETDEKFTIKITFDTYQDWLDKEADFRKLVENSNADLIAK